MSEYITLASNIKGTQPNDENLISNFNTKLGKLVTLKDEWVVGVSDITYTKSWYNILKTHTISVYDAIGNDTLYPDMKIKAGFYESPQKLVNVINNVIKIISDPPPHLIYNEINNYVTLIPAKIDDKLFYPYLGDEIEDMLGLRLRKNNLYSTNSSSNIVVHTEDIFLKRKFKGYHPVEIAGGFESLFLYSDIVYPSLVGDSCTNLLRTIEVPKKYKFGETVHLAYDTPHYRRVMLNNFETIHLSLCDSAGIPVPFKFGLVSLTLHFKKL